MCHVALGDRGTYTHSRKEISAIREVEAKNAATIIGATHVSLGISDSEVNNSNRSQHDLLVDLVRQTQPNVLLTHHPSDYNPDHVAAGKLAEDASFTASLPLYITEHEAHTTPPAVYYIDTLAGIGFNPIEYVDITVHIDQKLAALACHKSQVEWLMDHDNVNILDQTRIANAYRGYQAGVRFAEGFIPAYKWLRTRTVRLLP